MSGLPVASTLDRMAILALVLTLAWLFLIAGVRSYLHVRRTGEVPIALRAWQGSPQWWARALSSMGLVLALASPVAELAGLPPIAVFDHLPLRLAGVALVLLGIAGTLISPVAMGASWRADVDPDLRTDLVTTGPYRLIRNPVLTSTATTIVGLALMVPNVLAVSMLVLCVVSMQIQVRRVEEPYLERVHGDAYRRYAATTGRFLPWIGRLGAPLAHSLAEWLDVPGVGWAAWGVWSSRRAKPDGLTGSKGTPGGYECLRASPASWRASAPLRPSAQDPRVGGQADRSGE